MDNSTLILFLTGSFFGVVVGIVVRVGSHSVKEKNLLFSILTSGVLLIVMAIIFRETGGLPENARNPFTAGVIISWILYALHNYVIEEKIRKMKESLEE